MLELLGQVFLGLLQQVLFLPRPPFVVSILFSTAAIMWKNCLDPIPLQSMLLMAHL